MKTRALLLGLSLLSSAVLADTYNNQVDFDYSTDDTANVFAIQGTHYIDQVTTDNTAWAEAAFMGRNTSVSLSYVDVDFDNYGDSNALSLGGDLYHNNIFVSLDVAYLDANDGDSDNSVIGELGYFFDTNWLVSVSGDDVGDFSDSLALNTKYILPLADGAFVNFEASFLNYDNDVTAAADYYWTAQSSVGLMLTTEDDVDFGLRAQHFFTSAIAARVEYTSLDDDDSISFGLTARF